MSNVQEWQQLANKELSRREKTVDSLVQQTAEGSLSSRCIPKPISIIWR